MATYNLEARYLLQHDLRALDDLLIDRLWEIFIEIGRFWAPSVATAPMKSNFLVFISNRIEIDYNYVADYRSAVEVMIELVKTHGRDEGVKRLLTDAAGTVFPPLTRLARSRQFVVNEFIHLFLALGGFKDFGSPVNYPGYIGGTNRPGHTPYRTYQKPE